MPVELIADYQAPVFANVFLKGMLGAYGED
jgi:hypothetical protein